MTTEWAVKAAVSNACGEAAKAILPESLHDEFKEAIEGPDGQGVGLLEWLQIFAAFVRRTA